MTVWENFPSTLRDIPQTSLLAMMKWALTQTGPNLFRLPGGTDLAKYMGVILDEGLDFGLNRKKWYSGTIRVQDDNRETVWKVEILVCTKQ